MYTQVAAARRLVDEKREKVSEAREQVEQQIVMIRKRRAQQIIVDVDVGYENLDCEGIGEGESRGVSESGVCDRVFKDECCVRLS